MTWYEYIEECKNSIKLNKEYLIAKMLSLIEVDSFQNTYFSLSSIKKEYWLGIEKLNTDDMTWEKFLEDEGILAMKSFN